MFGIGTQEFLIILLVVLLLFGGKRIPEVARSIGAGLRDFRRAMRDVQREVDLEGMIRPPLDEGKAAGEAPRPAAARLPPRGETSEPGARHGGIGAAGMEQGIPARGLAPGAAAEEGSAAGGGAPEDRGASG
jgi:sec-independent protein translocase protein TatA